MKRKILLFILCIILFSTTVGAGKINYKFEICGKSMYPAINKNRYCGIYTVQTIKANETQIGDIICYNYNKRDYLFSNLYVCHRIIDKTNEHICTKGDNNNYSDISAVENKYVALKVVL